MGRIWDEGLVLATVTELTVLAHHPQPQRQNGDNKRGQ